MFYEYETLEYPIIKGIIAEYCAFSGGKKIILETNPSFSKLIVKRELARMKEALASTFSYGEMPFPGIRDITEAVIRAQKGSVLTCTELLWIVAHNNCVHSCNDYLSKVDLPTAMLEELVFSLATFDEMDRRINSCISSAAEVKDSASSTLSSLRKAISKTGSDIDRTLQRFIQQNSSILMDNISAMRNDRSVVLVKNAYKNQVDGIQYGESASGAAVYIEPGCMISLNNELQNLYHKLQLEIERILRELSELVGNNGAALLANMETLAILDSLFAKARFGKDTNGCVANLSEDDSLSIINARHPLIDRTKVISNSYSLKKPHRILLITGPNTGGKTVTLKTIGLFVIMTLSGMPICCDEAIIPMYDNIFVDIGDQQSIEQSLSTFSGHIATLANIFKKSTTKSLVILDELCSGTDPKEGENLAIAILEYFREKNIFVIASTHYSKLKIYGKQHEDILLSSVTFDMEKLMPTYRYKEGVTGQSNAFDIALRYGFIPEIIAKARELKSEDVTEQEVLIETLDKQVLANDQLNERLHQRLEQVEHELETLKKKQDFLKSEEEKLILQAKEQANVIVEEALIKSEEIIDELKKKENYKMHEAIEITSKLSKLSYENEEENEVIDTDFKVGDTVKIIKTDYLGEIISLDKKQAVVLTNGIRMKVKLDGLKKETKQKIKKEKSSVYVNKRKSISLECNLIGKRVEEGMFELSKYLDDAILMNLPTVRIVHGHGTGAMRTAVWEYLKKNKHVKDFRYGTAYEGGNGATVVVLREE